MKKIAVLALFTCVFSDASSQDLIKEIQKLTLVNDSLQKENKYLTGILDKNY